ncbi:MAG: WYL domain-containing protein, partial [Ginsengibacter sp.]
MSAHLERLIRIYNRLRRGPVTIEIISKWAKQAGILVSDRQLYRDLEQIKSIALTDGEIVKDFINEKNKKTWKLEFKEKSEKLSAFDINSFFLLKNFAPYAVIEQRKVSIEKFEKIIYKNFSQNNFQKYVQANELFERKTNYYENLYHLKEHEKIEDIIWCLQNKRVIVIEKDLINCANIDVSENSFPLQMLPMELVFHRGRIHLSGFSKTSQFLIFAIDKDFDFTLTNETFNRKKLLQDYKNYFEKLFGISKPINNKVYHIKLEFTKNYAESLKTFYWHNSQRWEQLKNGNYMLHLDCSIGRELLGFVAVGLAMIKVHQPEILRQLILKKVRETADLYEKDLEI